MIDTEKVLEAGFSGLNTRAGDLLTVKFKYNTPAAGGAVAATRIANLMHIVLRSDHILEIHDTEVVMELNDRVVDDVMESCFVYSLSLISVCENVDAFVYTSAALAFWFNLLFMVL